MTLNSTQLSIFPQGFLEDSTAEGAMAGCPVTGIRVVVQDGASHLVDSSEIAFRLCAQGAFKQGREITSVIYSIY